jgi:tetratricopeptide (TPR) repeat protein
VAPDFGRAEAVLRAATAMHPADARLVAMYERIGREPGRERALVDALELRAGLPGADAAPFREAATVARALGDAARAEALLRKLVARTEEDGSPARAAEPQARAQLAWATAQLGELREDAGDVTEAVLWKRRAAGLAEGADARALSFEVARLAKERLGDLALAAQVYEELLAREPADREAWEPLLDVYRAGGDHAKRAALIARVAPLVDDAGERSRLRLERARVTMNELGAGDDAAPMLREIVDEDPTQVDAALLLAAILERTGREEELAELLARQIDAAKDRSDSASVASLSLRLGAIVVEARPVYYAALEWDPKNPDLLRALLALLVGDDDVHDRGEILERLLPLEEGDAAVDAALALADIRAKLGDDDAARRALEEGFRAVPSSKALRDRLEAEYASAGEWAKVAELYETEASAMPDKRSRVARLREAAQIWREMQNDPERAAEVLRRARGEMPDDVELLMELVELLAASRNKQGAALELSIGIDWLGDDRTAIAPLLVRRAALRDDLGDHDGALFDLEHAFRVGGDAYAKRVVEYLEKLVASAWEAGEEARWRAMRLRLAEVLPLAGDADQARMLLGDLLKHDAKDKEALRALARLEERAEGWDAASNAYRRLVALEDGQHVVDTALHLADACARAGRLADARGGLERARLVAPSNEQLTSRLLALYEATGAHRELAALHLDEAKAAREVSARFAHLRSAGTLLLEHGSDASAAVAPLREANALRPGDLECSARLAEALAAMGKTQEATELLASLLAQHKGRRSRELSLLHLAMAHVARHAGDEKAEIASLTSALDMDPQNGAVASELALRARDAEQWELAQRALRAVTMLKSPAPLSRGLAYQYLGEIAQKQGDVKRAVMLLKRAVDDDPSLASAKALLAQLKAE